mmetsp:Transcript_24836/g.51980  ORF Transcript_24836/g.51980 Transcript_24836/m.51980 type:complete len:233 (-) Transcript_24836:21-719(-)
MMRLRMVKGGTANGAEWSSPEAEAALWAEKPRSNHSMAIGLLVAAAVVAAREDLRQTDGLPPRRRAGAPPPPPALSNLPDHYHPPLAQSIYCWNRLRPAHSHSRRDPTFPRSRPIRRNTMIRPKVVVGRRAMMPCWDACCSSLALVPLVPCFLSPQEIRYASVRRIKGYLCTMKCVWTISPIVRIYLGCEDDGVDKTLQSVIACKSKLLFGVMKRFILSSSTVVRSAIAQSR